MIETLTQNDRAEHLVELLRSELEGYGALLALLNQQQSEILERRPEALTEQVVVVDEASERAARRRHEREDWVRACVLEAGLEEEASVHEWLPFCPVASRPLVEGLVDEINRTLDRSQQRARQNQILLARAIQTIEQIVRLIQPDAGTRTYSRKGQMNQRGPVHGGGRILGTV
ncbi:MAG: flagellar export chaperone FlgN [Opitutales bacterium]